MSKPLVSCGCFFLLCLGSHGQAQQPNGRTASSVVQADQPSTARERTSVRAPSLRDAEDIIDKKLEGIIKTPLDYEGEQLNFVLENIAEQYDFPIIFDKAALDEIAISPESEITVRLRAITLRAALKIIFKEPGLEDLTFMIEDEVLLITTRGQASSTLVVRIYPIDDLVEVGAREAQTDKNEPSVLIDTVTACVERDSWKRNGDGHGEIQYLEPAMLVVSQSYEVQRQIKALLDQIRRVKHQIISQSGTH